MSQALQHNELNETLTSVSRELNENIRGLETTVDQIPSLSGMAGLCCLCEGVSYVNRHDPVWSGSITERDRWKYILQLVCQETE